MIPDRHPTSLKGHAADALDAEAGRVFDSYLAALESGRSPDPEGLLAAHPHLADQLRACLEVMQWADRLAEGQMTGPGFLLGDFRIVREIGRGGMGIVYEAEQLSLDRRVALKILPVAAAIDSKQFRRFHVESHAAACLHHTHIVPVFTTGHERGVYYYAMQYIEGQGLDAVIHSLRELEGLEETVSTAPQDANDSRVEFPRGRGFFETAARLGIQAAEALDHAHALGIVHRDIKPANLLVDVRGDLWVTDFGLARVQADSGLTATGDVLGTMRYMSPEQVVGEQGLIDHRSDIYSLGATLYELLTLRPAHDGRDRAQRFRRTGPEEPKPPRLLNPAIPRDLETIVLKAIAREAPQRYASARDLADDLRRFLDRRPIQARRPSLWMRTNKMVRRHRVAVMSVATALLILVAACAVIFTLQRHNRNLQLAVRQDQYAKDIGRAFHLVEQSELAGAARVLEGYRPSTSEPDIRTFPWYYLWRICRFQPRTLPGHTDSTLREVYHVEFSPRGDTLASCGQDRTIRLWDPETGRLKRVLHGHEYGVNWVAFSPTASKLGTGCDDGTVCLWDLAAEGDPRPVTLGKHDDWVLCVLFTPDGRRLISTGRDGQVKVWEVATGRMLRSFAAHPGHIEGMAVSPDGRTLATATADRIVKLWSLDTYQELLRFVEHTGSVNSVAVSRHGRLFASAGGGDSNEVRLWDAGTGRSMASGVGHKKIVQCVAFSPDDRLLATCGTDCTIRLWDSLTALPLEVYRAEPYRLWCVAFSPDGRTLASCGDDGMIRLWDVGVRQERMVLRLPVSRVDSLALPPGSNELIVAGPPREGGRGRVSVSSWDLRRDTPPRLLQILSPGEDLSCILSQDGGRLATRDASGTLRLWDLATGSPGESVKLPEAEYYDLSGFEGSLLLVNMINKHWNSPVVWDLGSGPGSLRFRGDVREAFLVPAIHGNSVVAGNDRRLYRWDRAADRVTRIEQPHDTAGSFLHWLAISRDGRRLASGRADYSIHVWDGRTLQWEATLHGHRGRVICLDFSPDGKVLASASDDGVVKLWDLATRQDLMTLEGVRGDPDGRRHLRFTPDGSALVYCFSDRKQGAAIVWTAPRDGEIHGQFRSDPSRPRTGDFASQPIGSSP